jgi:hypothetical protein
LCGRTVRVRIHFQRSVETNPRLFALTFKPAD